MKSNMQCHVVRGTIESLGPYTSSPKGGATYTYIAFTCDDGTLLRTENTTVDPAIDAYLTVGASGTFIVQKTKERFAGLLFGGIRPSSTTIHAAKIGDREFFSRMVSDPGQGQRAALILGLLSFPLMFLLVGFVLLPFCVIAFFALPLQSRQIKDLAKANGFTLAQKTRTL